MKCKKISLILSSIILSIGILGSGFFVGKFLYSSKLINRTVTVKGLAERDVISDLGIFEIDYREVGNNLIDINTRLLHDQQLVIAFLKQHGFTDQELTVQPAKVEDRLANVYSQNSGDAAANRYVITTGVRVRSKNVNRVQEVYQLSGTLLQQGVAVVFDIGSISPNPSFYFTELDKIRPDILSDATQSALTIAQQFAKDSHSRLNGIQHASQGVFQLMTRDASSMNPDSQSALGSIEKKVRLVTTIEYRLK